MRQDEESVKTLGEAAKWLAGSIPVAVAALTVAGISGSELGRVVRIYPVFYAMGVLALVVAVVLGAVGLLSKYARQLFFVGVIAFALGTATLVTLHAAATSKQDRPTVSASLITDGDVVTAEITVKAAGLRTDQYLFVAMQGQNSQRHLDSESAEYAPGRPPIPRGEYSKQRIYSGRIGATPDGNAESSFKVPLARDLYEQIVVQAAILSGPSRDDENELMFGDRETGAFLCGPETANISCITLLMPQPPGQVTRQRQ